MQIFLGENCVYFNIIFKIVERLRVFSCFVGFWFCVGFVCLFCFVVAKRAQNHTCVLCHKKWERLEIAYSDNLYCR